MSQPTDIEPEAVKTAAREALKREVIEFVKMVVWFLVLFATLKTFVIEGYEVQGDSMDPTLRDRERILVFKLPHNIAKLGWFSWLKPIEEGDIVVFDSLDETGKRYVKRVIACGPRESGNLVSAEQHGSPQNNRRVRVLVEEGTVYVNHRRLPEDYLTPEAHHLEAVHEEAYVPPNSYYVMGDNRRVSKDSRSFGAVDDGCVIGRAVLRFWPLSRFGLVQ